MSDNSDQKSGEKEENKAPEGPRCQPFLFFSVSPGAMFPPSRQFHAAQRTCYDDEEGTSRLKAAALGADTALWARVAFGTGRPGRTAAGPTQCMQPRVLLGTPTRLGVVCACSDRNVPIRIQLCCYWFAGLLSHSSICDRLWLSPVKENKCDANRRRLLRERQLNGSIRSTARHYN